MHIRAGAVTNGDAIHGLVWIIHVVHAANLRRDEGEIVLVVCRVEANFANATKLLTAGLDRARFLHSAVLNGELGVA